MTSASRCGSSVIPREHAVSLLKEFSESASEPCRRDPSKGVAGCCNELLHAKAMKAASANASAAWYSLETAKANELEPSRYLRFLFERLPYGKNVGGLRQLTPLRLDLKEFKSAFPQWG